MDAGRPTGIRVSPQSPRSAGSFAVHASTGPLGPENVGENAAPPRPLERCASPTQTIRLRRRRAQDEPLLWPPVPESQRPPRGKEQCLGCVALRSGLPRQDNRASAPGARKAAQDLPVPGSQNGTVTGNEITPSRATNQAVAARGKRGFCMPFAPRSAPTVPGPHQINEHLPCVLPTPCEVGIRTTESVIRRADKVSRWIVPNRRSTAGELL